MDAIVLRRRLFAEYARRKNTHRERVILLHIDAEYENEIDTSHIAWLNSTDSSSSVCVAVAVAQAHP